MKCPACGTDGSAVSKTIDDGKAVIRQRRCDCGVKWTTNERYQTGTLVAIAGHPRPLIAKKPPLVATASDRAVVSESDLPSELFPGSLSNPGQTQTRVEPEDPIVFAGFVLANGETWDLRAKGDASLARSFPSLDRAAFYAKAAGWLDANPAKRKTAKGMQRFLYGWLERATNSGRGTPVNGVPAGGIPVRQARSAGNVDVLQRWLAKTDDKGAA